MTTSTDTSRNAPRKSDRIGLVVLGSIAFGFVLGLVLVLIVFAGGEESQITGSALLALGAGFMLLAAASSRFTDQPQRWALAPGIASAVLGLVILLFSPGNRALGLAGWVWPVLLVLLVGWSVWGARRSLHNWSRRVLLYPSLFVLLLVAVGGAYETLAEATTSNPAPAGRTYLVNGHRLYLNCVGTGAPTVVLFNGLGERTPSWAWVQRRLASMTRVCAFDRAGQGWSGAAPGRQDGHELASDLHGLLNAAGISGPYVLAGHSTGGTYALVYAGQYPQQVAGVALIEFGHAVSVRSPRLCKLLLAVATHLGPSSLSFRMPGTSDFALNLQASRALPSDAGGRREPCRDAPRGRGRPRRVRRAADQGLRPGEDDDQAWAETARRLDGHVDEQDGRVAGPSEARATVVRPAFAQRRHGATHSSLLEDERHRSDARVKAIAHVVQVAR